LGMAAILPKWPTMCWSTIIKGVLVLVAWWILEGWLCFNCSQAATYLLLCKLLVLLLMLSSDRLDVLTPFINIRCFSFVN
jgi:hypothetical protein